MVRVSSDLFATNKRIIIYDIDHDLLFFPRNKSIYCIPVVSDLKVCTGLSYRRIIPFITSTFVKINKYRVLQLET